MENVLLLYQHSSLYQLPPLAFFFFSFLFFKIKSLNLVLNSIHEILCNMLIMLFFNFNSTEEALLKRITISQGNQEIKLYLLGFDFPISRYSHIPSDYHLRGGTA